MITSLQLRKDIRDRFAWPGGYEMFGITKDGGILCVPCMRNNYWQIAYSRKNGINDGWYVEAVGCTEEIDNAEWCSHCNQKIEA